MTHITAQFKNHSPILYTTKSALSRFIMIVFRFLRNLFNQLLQTITSFVRSYMQLFTQSKRYYGDTGNDISREQFKNGCALFVFDMTPQLDSAEAGFELMKRGNIRIEIHFANTVAKTLTVIVFGENDRLLEVDQNRNVGFNYEA